MKIKIEKRSEDYMAYLTGHKEIWGCDKTSYGAIRDLLRCHKDTFGNMMEDEILEEHEIPDERVRESQDEYIKRKRLELLDETVLHFSKNPRAFTDREICSYKHSVNGGCAIGRKLPPKLSEEIIENSIAMMEVWDQIPVYLKFLGQEFLVELQKLHDWNYFWETEDAKNYGPLSKVGEIKVEKMKQLYC